MGEQRESENSASLCPQCSWRLLGYWGHAKPYLQDLQYKNIAFFLEQGWELNKEMSTEAPWALKFMVDETKNYLHHTQY